MTDPAFDLRTGQTGAFVTGTPGTVLTFQADGSSVRGEPIPSAPVLTVFGRVLNVVAALNDYAASLVANDSSVAGATVKAALNTLLAAIPTVPVTSVFARTAAVVAALNDYAASLVANDSSVAGATVKDALNNLLGLSTSFWVFNQSWGTGTAPASVAQRFLPRTNSTVNGGFYTSEYPIAFAGTFLFTVTWRIGLTPLALNSVVIQVYINGVASTLFATIPASTTSGQFTGLLTVAAKDGVAVGLLQSGTEAQANWMLNVNVVAAVP